MLQQSTQEQAIFKDKTYSSETGEFRLGAVFAVFWWGPVLLREGRKAEGKQTHEVGTTCCFWNSPVENTILLQNQGLYPSAATGRKCA